MWPKVWKAFSIVLSLMSFFPAHEAFADLPYLHERTASVLYGPAYRALFQDERSIPSWIQDYNSILKGVEKPGERVFLKGRLFERYKICQSDSCNGHYLIVLFTPGGREAWAASRTLAHSRISSNSFEILT